ncbi:MAG TPA: hypothetical protein VFU05_09370 [Cyclobacteriaceae bacterium]|nr:hypothetical protein [Cyclobacteriaceae bacterium]
MTSKRTLLLTTFLLAGLGGATAQLKLPTFDVEVKVQQTLVPGSGESGGEFEFVETTNFYAGGHVQINQYIAIGGYYGRSFRGMGKFSFDDNSVQNEILQLQKGIDIRISTSRAKNWRKYLVVNYGQIEMVKVGESFRSSDKTSAFGFNLGIMRRLSNNLSLNVIELGVKIMSDTMFWLNTEDTKLIMADAKIGLTYNIGKKK